MITLVPKRKQMDKPDLFVEILKKALGYPHFFEFTDTSWLRRFKGIIELGYSCEREQE